MLKKSTISVILVLIVLVQLLAQEFPPEVILKDGQGPVSSIRYSPDGKLLARVCMFGMPMIFETDSFIKFRSFNIGMRMISFSPDSKLIATAEGRDGMRIWDLSDKGTLIPGVMQIKYQVYVLEKPLKVLQEPSKEDSMKIRFNEFSPDGKMLINAHENGSIKFWDTKTWENKAEIALSNSTISALKFSPDNKNVIVGFVSGEILIVDTEKKIITKSVKSPGLVTGIEISPDGNLIITSHASSDFGGSNGSFIMIWKNLYESGISTIKQNYTKASFSADNKMLALAADKIEIFQLPEMNLTRTINLPKMSMVDANSKPELFINSIPENKKTDYEKRIQITPTDLIFSSDSKSLAIGTSIGTIHIYKL